MGNHSLMKVQPYYEQIYKSLKKQIFQGIYESGERLNEAQIAKEFNVSRSPVREAVRALEKEGLLVFNDKSQLTVYKPAISDVEDIYQCRKVLESLAVVQAVDKSSDGQIREIGQALTEMNEKLQEGIKDKNELIALNEKFHGLIIGFSQNRRLQKLLESLTSLTHYYRGMNIEGEDRKYRIFTEHQEIYSCMQNRNASDAGALMAEHIVNDLDHLKGILKQ